MFQSSREHISASFRMLKSLRDCDLSMVPDPILAETSHAATQLAETMKEMRVFHQNMSTDRQTHSMLGAQLQERYNSLFHRATPLIAFSRQHGSDHQETERRARELLTTIQDMRSEEQKSLESMRLEAQRILEEIKKVGANIAVAREAEHFESEAQLHKRSASLWLGGVGLSAAAVSAIAIYASMHVPVPNPNEPVAITILVYIPRFILLSIAFYAMALCGRNYRTSRHNFIVNRHRALALTTFEAFVRSAADPKVKDAVLAQAASTIFSAQPSGYAVDQAEPLPQATAVELIQRIAGK